DSRQLASRGSSDGRDGRHATTARDDHGMEGVQVWPSGGLLRHDRGAREAPSLLSRRWAWVHLSTVVFFSFYFVGSLRDGQVWDVVKWGLFALGGISNLARSLMPEQHTLTSVARVVGGLAFGTLCTGGAVRFTIDAVQASGGERIFLAVVGVFFYLFAALLI